MIEHEILKASVGKGSELWLYPESLAELNNAAFESWYAKLQERPDGFPRYFRWQEDAERAISLADEFLRGITDTLERYKEHGIDKSDISFGFFFPNDQSHDPGAFTATMTVKGVEIKYLIALNVVLLAELVEISPNQKFRHEDTGEPLEDALSYTPEQYMRLTGVEEAHHTIAEAVLGKDLSDNLKPEETLLDHDAKPREIRALIAKIRAARKYYPDDTVLITSLERRLKKVRKHRSHLDSMATDTENKQAVSPNQS